MPRPKYEQAIEDWEKEYGVEAPDEIKKIFKEEFKGQYVPDPKPYGPINAIFDVIKWGAIIFLAPVWIPLYLIYLANDFMSPRWGNRTHSETNWRKNL